MEDKKSWKEKFNINEKKAGKYNVMITAQDQSGNTAVEGPYNIYIDPESDLPVTEVTNPRQNMHVPGNLNIVGTCVDDDSVKKVEIILDDDIEHPLTAEGTEFWSYFLDTTSLKEGQHKISVYGYDENDLKGHEQTILWHLDRNQPKVEITNLEMGSTVSGHVKLEGQVSDGNGIAQLLYSFDRGEHYQDAKLKANKDGTVCTFSISVDTKKLEDGGVICFFKTSDKQGTKGSSSFLFFVDNTKPDVKVVYPAENEAVNGKTVIAGYAKDVIGITSLTWSMAGQTGLIPVVPGNPYWSAQVDLRGISSKNSTFTIVATDAVGNVTTLNQKILIDNAADKASVSIQYPKEGQTIDSQFFLRGIAKDDDGIAKVFYSLDGKKAVSLETDSVFNFDLNEKLEAPLAAGSHSLKVWAQDIHEVEGNPLTVKFTVKGKKPAFENIMVNKGKGSSDIEYQPGLEINPEEGGYLKLDLTSESGLKSASYFFADMPEADLAIAAGKTKATVTIPIEACPFGFAEITVKALDIYDRLSEKTLYFYVSDLSRTRGKSSVVVTDDLTEDGLLKLSDSHPASGFFVGGSADFVRFDPATNFASISLDGNAIVIKSSKARGLSEPVSIVVRSKKGIDYRSQTFVMKAGDDLPVISGINDEGYDAQGNFIVSGTVNNVRCASNPRFSASTKDISYRIMTAKSKSEWISLETDKNDFSISLSGGNFAEGISIIEIRATDSLGQTGYKAAFVKKITPLAEGEKLSPPSLSWVEGNDYYYIANYRSNLQIASLKIDGIDNPEYMNPFFGTVKRADLKEGISPLEVSIVDAAEKTYTAVCQAKKIVNPDIYFAKVDGRQFYSGSEILLAEKGGNAKMLSVEIESYSPVTAVKYAVNDESYKVIKEIQKISDIKYQVEIPLADMKAELAQVKLEAVNANGGKSEAKATISIVREYPLSLVNNKEKIYWQKNGKDSQGFFLMKPGDTFTGFANLPAPLKVQVNARGDSVTARADGQNIIITVLKTGIYKDLNFTVTDAEGIAYTTESISFLVDEKEPRLTINSPENAVWLQNRINLTGSFSDDLMTSKIEYSIDNGESWKNLSFTEKNEFNQKIDFSEFADGLVSLDVRVTDRSEKVSEKHFAFTKQTALPEVSVLLPCQEDLVNGENLMVFKLDNANSFVSAYYGDDRNNALKIDSFIPVWVGTEKMPISNRMSFTFTDKSGNSRTINEWKFVVDAKSDLPVPEIHIPFEGEFFSNDFLVSGVVLDDDGPCKIWYKIDDGKYNLLEGSGNSFSIPMKLKSLTDNNHTIYVYGEDIHGIKSEPIQRNFMVSLEEPKGEVVMPSYDMTIKGMVRISGWASDNNDIDKVEISVDNGISWNETVGSKDWSYEFDTRVINDGTHPVFIRVFDKCGVQAIYSSLINIDNTVPDLSLELPEDGSRTTKMLFLSGQATDNIGLTRLNLYINALDARYAGTSTRVKIEPEQIITRQIDISDLPDGFYNIYLEGEDAAGNVTRVSRNVELRKKSDATSVDILTPMNGEYIHGIFNLYGKVESESPVKSLHLSVDGKEIATGSLAPTGFFKFPLSPKELTDGKHKFQVKAALEDGKIISSNTVNMNYTMQGPWITIDNFDMGNFAVNRPYIEGKAGYSLSEEEVMIAKDKTANSVAKKEILNKSVQNIQISWDNGKTFTDLGGNKEWRYRIENDEMASGYHFLVVKATMYNGETVSVRSVVQIDKEAPRIKLIAPISGGRYNEELVFAGTTSDDINLKDVTIALRKGDKSNYELPGFIQGLYFDAHLLGATLYDVGLGVTFFDDNVKLQFQFGQMTEEQYNLLCNWVGYQSEGFRYGGNVYGMKLLANIFYLPFKYFMGPNWDWLSMSMALGANFSIFTETQSKKAQVLSAIIAQLEFPRVTMSNQKYFRTFSIYSEFQLWFIPTDVESEVDIQSVVPQYGIGARINVF
ncbi:MAG: hypothetical protein K5839_04350 [Treponemataceae bacterium]|nr:hypothetical protein [Treponemataceae bacterium]